MSSSLFTKAPSVGSSDNSSTLGGVVVVPLRSSGSTPQQQQQPMEESPLLLRKFRNLITSSPRPTLTWSQLNQSPGQQDQAEATKKLVYDFLKLVSGRTTDIYIRIDRRLDPARPPA